MPKGKLSLWIFLPILLFLGAIPGSPQDSAQTSPLAVRFTDCTEFFALVNVSTMNARTLIPPQFHLLGESGPTTPLLVRAVHCDGIAANGHQAKEGAIVQIGLPIVPPDGTGDFNNYLLWYLTTNSLLADDLRHAGVPAQFVQRIAYNVQLSPGQTVPFFVDVPVPAITTLQCGGTVTASANPQVFLLANWWTRATGVTVKMSTSFPDIVLGSANLVMTTSPDGQLGQVLGSGGVSLSPSEFFNHFSTADMQVTRPQLN